MTAISAIRQSLQTHAGPGSSVNAHPNPFMLNVNGELDLQKAAQTVIAQLDVYDKHTAKEAEAAAKAPAAPIAG
jgi:hypothetical protein